MKRLASIIIMLSLCIVSWGQVSFATNSAIRFPDAPGYDLTNDFTLVTWVYLKSMESGDAFMSKTEGNPFRGWMWRITAESNTAFSAFGGEHMYSTVQISTNKHHFLAVSAAGTNVTHYIDSVPSGSGTRPTVIASTVNMGVGGWGGGAVWALSIDGYMSDSRLYSRALSAQEISEIYARPWSLADDPALVLRTCIVTNDTGTALIGTAYNYGTGADGTYSNSPTVAQPHVQTEKPLTMELP